MKRFVCTIGAVSAALLVIFACSPLGEKLGMGRWTESVGLADMLERAQLSGGGLQSSTGAWVQRLAVAIEDLDHSMVDPQVQVLFGSGKFNPASDTYEIHWGGTPSNVVKVTARSGHPISTRTEGVVPVVFKGVFGNDGSLLSAEATAYINAPNLLDAGNDAEHRPMTTRLEQP